MRLRKNRTDYRYYIKTMLYRNLLKVSKPIIDDDFNANVNEKIVYLLKIFN